ncbi:hypothetical protein EX30DRAFT_342601 [Ascodesmis nigricans]|uniref:Acid protease n=1 Tax=Ascodesmis nigricans TaxID=341454 RepID=A0A4S2MSM0_9PEZI|nr:hypothetical protein EX30DRAFT_342601 [Ascodesmis nigricans]
MSTPRRSRRPCSYTNTSCRSQSALLLFLSFSTLTTAQTPFRVPYSKKRFGLDGPWNAVEVKVGGQQLYLYPGRFAGSLVPDIAICEPFSKSDVNACPVSGTLYDFESSETSFKDFDEWARTKNVDQFLSYEQHWYARNGIDALTLSDNAGREFTLNTSLKVAMEKSVTVLPSGLSRPPDLGLLSLGSTKESEVWNGKKQWATTVPLIGMEMKGEIPSRTFALHIGSALLGIEGSLIFGGYDKARVMEEPTAYDFGKQPLDLEMMGISVGIAEGGKPAKSFKTGSIYSKKLSISLAPGQPHMYLPEEICTSLAERLPVKFNKDWGLYIWDTKNADFEAIVTSSAYIAFNFPSTGTSRNIVKVPFKLLNLQLSSAYTLAEEPVQYFPCRPVGSDEPILLGRAFLQAAITGINWHQKKLWLGQAPGPDIGVTAITPLEKTDTELKPSAGNDWLKSWKGTWKVYDKDKDEEGDDDDKSPGLTQVDDVRTDDENDKGGSSGVSTGALIGIVVGVVVAVLAAFGVWLCFRRKRSKELEASGELLQSQTHSEGSGMGYSRTHPTTYGRAEADPEAVKWGHNQQQVEYYMVKGPEPAASELADSEPVGVEMMVTPENETVVEMAVEEHERRRQ